jgi:hypothetical protein
MKRLFLIIIFAIYSVLFLHSVPSFAIEDPLSLPNNKMGIHILFPQEIFKAAELINSSGGDWGYVTIPIQSGDKDLVKWQKFMDDAKKLHLIPIVRLATQGDYFNTTVWNKPSQEDVLDFANFLNSLSWPVKNKYVVIFNEVNRSDEWGGSLDPSEYAQLLSYAVSTFKSSNNDFFIITSGLDNAAPNEKDKYMNEYDYMAAMNNALPGIFGLVDGLGSHSYPNPGFKQMPTVLTSRSINSFSYEKALAFRLSGKNLPIFITETGWSKDALSENQISQCFRYAFENVWTGKDIAVVSPFLLQAGTEPFSKFSLLDAEGKRSQIFTAIQQIPKVIGEPSVSSESANLLRNASPQNLPLKTFSQKSQYEEVPSGKIDAASGFFKWLLKLYI